MNDFRRQQIDVTADDSSPESLLAALRASPRHTCVIVDFDETLWLRNSTEEYLSSLRPRFLAILILSLIDFLKPWTLVQGTTSRHLYRDWIRVLTTSILLPWSLPLWRWHAPHMAAAWKNTELIAVLKSECHAPVYIATFGFAAIVEPILKHIDLSTTICAAGSLWSGYRLRRIGKSDWIEREIGQKMIQGSLVITDSEDDADILRKSRTPILIRWPNARYEQAFSKSYIPFLYTQKGKRPGGNYMYYGVLLEDVVLLCISFAWLMPFPILGAVTVLLLHLSFWVVYEIGYVENDTVAVKHETKPNIPSGTAAYFARVKSRHAWFVASVFAAPGIALLTYYNLAAAQWIDDSTPFLKAFYIECGLWIIFLSAARGVFWIYNRTDVKYRAYLYPTLQLTRTLGYAFLLKTNIVGAMLLLSLVLSRWLPYLTYRYVGQYKPDSYRPYMLACFLILSLGGITIDFNAFLGVQFLAGVLWLTALVHPQLRILIRAAREF